MKQRMHRIEKKERLNQVFAKVGKGLSHANRLQLLEILAQGERDVDSIAKCSDMSVANTSHHLKLLRDCGLIVSRREGQRMVYSLADDSVVTLISIMHSIAMRNLPEMDRLLATWFPPDRPIDEIGIEEAAELINREDVLVYDHRPEEEYRAGHLPGAQLVTPEVLEQLPDADGDALCILYCRGQFCLFPIMAERILRPKGYRVKRLVGGFPAWRIGGQEVVEG